MTKKPQKALGLWMLTALVAGNMIGSGIFLLPANLASIGSISLVSWLFTATGAFCLAIVFSKMSLMVPKAGGPYAFAEAGFGKFIGFQTAFNYWIAVWVGNASIVIALVSYLTVFFPSVRHPLQSYLVALGILWSLTYVNIRGVKGVGITSLITTICKLLPILLVAIFGWFYFHPSYLTDAVNLSHSSNFSAVSQAATLTLWAFIGLESATVPADYVDNPQRNIPLATLLGTGIAAVVYIASSTAIMGMIPADILANSTSPFAAAASIIFGSHWGEWIIAVGAIISCAGALNGWILLQGQVPMAAAKDGLFPKIFCKLNKADVPAIGIVITSLLISIILLLTSNPNLVTQFRITILIASLTSLVPYLYTAIAEFILLHRCKTCLDRKSKFHVIIALLAGAYAFWAILGAGQEVNFYGSIVILSSIPLYALFHLRTLKMPTPKEDI